MNEQDIRAFANIVRSSSNIVFFGGAGVSTESGLKDYRSENGIYTAVQQYGAPPEEILSHDYF
ncbi:MAG: NAD-dependent protein deacylase, partial [Clostridia bacterium]|nr:NAD-dependent protein deacylase [Clostridia bacterium]